MLIYDIRSHPGKTSPGDESSPEDLANDLRAYGVSKVGTNSLSGISTGAQNDLVRRAVEVFPGVTKGYALINPKAPNATDRMNRCLRDYGINGVKFHSWKHGYYPDNTPALSDVLAEIRKYGVHAQTYVGTAPFSTPYTWVEYARKFPNINFFFTHIGYCEFRLSVVEAAKDLENVWVETSGQMDVDVLLRVIDVLGPERACFRTDRPYEPVNIEVEEFYEPKVPEEKLEYILHKNVEYLQSHSSRCL